MLFGYHLRKTGSNRLIFLKILDSLCLCYSIGTFCEYQLLFCVAMWASLPLSLLKLWPALNANGWKSFPRLIFVWFIISFSTFTLFYTEASITKRLKVSVVEQNLPLGIYLKNDKKGGKEDGSRKKTSCFVGNFCFKGLESYIPENSGSKFLFREWQKYRVRMTACGNCK